MKRKGRGRPVLFPFAASGMARLILPDPSHTLMHGESKRNRTITDEWDDEAILQVLPGGGAGGDGRRGAGGRHVSMY